MAIIGKIREKSGLLVAIVGLGLFLFIIPVNDLLQQFNGTGNSSLGLFNDSEIDANDWKYYNRENKTRNNLRINNLNSGGNGSLTSDEEDQIKINTWNQMISDTIYFFEFDKVGLDVSADELNQGLLNGEKPLPSSLKELFVTNGLYNKDSFNIWKTNRIINLPDNPESKRDLKNNIEDPLKNERKINKYSAMVKYGILGTVQEAKRTSNEEKITSNINYIFIDYNEIDDSLIDLNEKEKRLFYNEHSNEKMWEQRQNLVSYDYSILKFNPSKTDVANYTERMESLIEDFKSSKNDSLFVANYAETPMMIQSPYGLRPSGNYTNQPYKGGKFSSFIDQKISSSVKGDIVGPFVTGDKIQLVKIYDTGEEEQAKVRHILISSKKEDLDDTKNKKLADSILYAIRRDSSKFSSLVTKYSDDPGSVANGGVYSWFPKGQMTAEFEEFSFSKKVGRSGVVRTNYGFHVIQVLGRKIGTFKKIAIVDETIQVSKATQNEFYDSAALALYYKADSIDFETAADDLGYEVKSSGYIPLIYPNRRTSGLYGPADLNRNLNISKWAFNSDVGDLLEPEYISNNQLVLAVLKEKIISFDNSYDNIITLMDPLIKNSLKAKYYVENFSKKLDSATSMDVISEITGKTIETKFVKYSDVNIGNNTQELAEPKVMAYIFSLNPEEISTIIEGKKGLYIIQCQKTNNQNRVDENTVIEKAQSEEKEIRTFIEQGYYPALYNSYKVRDDRAKNMILNN
ncbi:MAG: peptidylprolyl isomerase [Flavobacteriales bacterium]|nr:peptidylprolyl isomerase [Flavobacteriales bacterium]MBL6869286.1 peptidylprolyl isomerase [Flavobacteriales bacterium]